MKQLLDALEAYNKAEHNLINTIWSTFPPGAAIKWYLWGRIHIGHVKALRQDVRIRIRNDTTGKAYLVNIYDVVKAYKDGAV